MTKYYKVLLHGRSCHGGDCEYALPMQREDGTWEPGEWMPEIRGPLTLCANGYHLTREPARWWREGAECYVAEWDGEYVGDGDGGDKIAVRRCRLLRRLTAAELASLRVFGEGSHQVSDGIVWASGSARVRAYGSAQVRAYGSAQVWASGSARVGARGSAQVWACGSAQVWAYDSAQVDAYDSAQVWAHDFAQVWAHDFARVGASGSAKVRARGFAKVRAHGFARVEAHDSARVEARDSAWVEARDSATVQASDSATVTTVSGQPTVTVEERAVWIDRRKITPVIHVIDGELVHEEA